MTSSVPSTCPGCSITIQEPYIRCAECTADKVDICLHCFARGVEFDAHESNHKYEVIKNDFTLFESTWTAAEELRLMDALVECGIGNWADISQQIRTKTKAECERHYNRCYLDNPVDQLADLPVTTDLHYHPCPISFRPCEDPPRPTENSPLQHDLSGYVAPRSEFTYEFDNFAEYNINDVEFHDGDSDFDRELKLAVLDVYNNVLRERHRRKALVREHGLIHLRKQTLFQRQLETQLGQRTTDLLFRCGQLMKAYDWDLYVKGLTCIHELKTSISNLQHLREQGVTTFRGAKIYNRLKRKREQKERGTMLQDLLRNMNDERTYNSWLQKQEVQNLTKGKILPLPSSQRRPAPPLDIVGMPSYEKLSEKERELCSGVRLVPASYLEFKQILIREAAHLGHLKLAQARGLIKIDVNKTRKIFDHLVNEGFINKENK